MDRRLIVFAPHPDDESFGCGGIISKRIEEGYEVEIVVMTDGRYAFSKVLGIESNPTPDELKLIRRKECIEAMKVLSVPIENLQFLDYEDEALRKHEKEAEKRIAEILNNSPSEICLPHGSEYHADHQAANRIVSNAIKNLSLTTSTYEYSITPKFSPRLLALRRLISPNIIRIDISKFLNLKKAAIAKYSSQVSIINKQQKKPVVSAVEIQRYLNNREVFFAKRFFGSTR